MSAEDLVEEPEWPTDLDWAPDSQLIASFLAGSPRTIADLSALDRCWVVAGLSARGIKAEEIRDRLKCSLRLVRTIKALAATKALMYAAVETRAFEQELALRDSALGAVRRELEEVRASRDRYKDKLDNLIDAHITGIEKCGRCGTPFDLGNTYTEVDASGYRKRRCRNCRRLAQQAYRDRRKGVVGEVPEGGLELVSTAGDPVLHLVGGTSGPDSRADCDIPPRA